MGCCHPLNNFSKNVTMAIDWSDLKNNLPNLIDSSVQATDQSLASEISSLTTMSQDEVKQLFPTPADVQSLTDLMEVVKGAQSQNDKINNIFSNVEKWGGTVLKLLSRV